MLSTIRNRKQQGFTIIEVLIVLAIAGLILLVVFLAVPALQRNARNTQRKEDVASLMGAVSEYVNSNNGNLPDVIATTSGNTIELQATGGGGNKVPVTLGYYAPADISITTFASNGANNNTTDGTVVLVKAAKCDPDDADIGKPLTASGRAIVALYTAEPAAKQCSES